MKLKRYRIVRDNYAGYECQIWRLWWPFWMQMGYTNTHSKIEYARLYIKEHKSKIRNKKESKVVEEYKDPLTPAEIRDKKLSKLGIK